jgi:iron complex transport system substrate-binding protein
MGKMRLYGFAILVALLASTISMTVASVAPDGHSLKVFGNANMDDIIDEADIEFLQGIIDGKNKETELADANYDGKIDENDIAQIKLIIAGKETAITIIDMADRTVTIPVPVDGVVLTHREQYEQLRAIKVAKNIVLTAERQIQTMGEYEKYFAEYQDLPDVGSNSDPNVEAIIGLHPDLILMGSYGENSSQHSASLSVFESAGIPVVYSHETDENFADNIRMLGYIFGKIDEANEYVDWRENLITMINERLTKVPDEKKRKVYVEWYGKYVTSNEDATHVGALGGNDIFGGNASGSINPEEVVKQNPDIVILIGGRGSGYVTDNTTELKGLSDEFMNRKELQDVTAVKTGEVYALSVYVTGTGCCHGGRDFVQDAYFAKWLNPSYFEDFDPKSIHQEYLTKFQGLDWNLDEHGVYVYHPEKHPKGN